MNRGNLAVVNATVVTPVDTGTPKRGSELKEHRTIENGAVLVRDGRISSVGDTQRIMSQVEENTTVIDAQGRLVTPGLVDPHTHVVHGGSREHEIHLKLAGASYMEIHNAGGGISSTVRSTRAATTDELYEQAKESLLQMLSLGVTSIESKSGYGLTTEDEIKMLTVSKRLEEDLPMDIAHTFMGAHSIPQEYKSNPEGYMDRLLTEMLPRVTEIGIAEFCDVFCEEGVFSVEQARRILQQAREYGLKLKMHADEIVSIGGAELAAELNVTSADHLMAASRKGLQMMAQGDTVAVILPGTSFYLRKEYARAREMVDMNVPIALATDYNPGSCPSENMQFIMTLGYVGLRLYPEEILTACTLNAAYAINRSSNVGSLDVGKKGDLVIWNANNIAFLPYHFGINHAYVVVKEGRKVAENGRVLVNV